MTDTPRVDSASESIAPNGLWIDWNLAYCSMLDFARQLECELAEARAEIARLHEQLIEDMVSVPVERLANLIDWMQREQDNLTCSDLCDKTWEFQGCQGECALDAGKRELTWWSNLIAAQPKGAEHDK